MWDIKFGVYEIGMNHRVAVWPGLGNRGTLLYVMQEFCRIGGLAEIRAFKLYVDSYIPSKRPVPWVIIRELAFQVLLLQVK